MDNTELVNELMETMQRLMHGMTNRKADVFLKGEEFVLQYLADCNASAQPGEISCAMGVSTARIAVTLNGLEEKGLISRRIDSSDRRRILVEITPRGEVFAQQRKQEVFRKTEQILIALGEEDSKQFLRILKKLAGIMPIIGPPV